MAGSRIVTVRGQGRRVAESCYLRYPHLARDLITFRAAPACLFGA